MLGCAHETLWISRHTEIKPKTLWQYLKRLILITRSLSMYNSFIQTNEQTLNRKLRRSPLYYDFFTQSNISHSKLFVETLKFTHAIICRFSYFEYLNLKCEPEDSVWRGSIEKDIVDIYCCMLAFDRTSYLPDTRVICRPMNRQSQALVVRTHLIGNITSHHRHSKTPKDHRRKFFDVNKLSSVRAMDSWPCALIAPLDAIEFWHLKYWDDNIVFNITLTQILNWFC